MVRSLEKLAGNFVAGHGHGCTAESHNVLSKDLVGESRIFRIRCCVRSANRRHHGQGEHGLGKG